MGAGTAAVDTSAGMSLDAGGAGASGFGSISGGAGEGAPAGLGSTGGGMSGLQQFFQNPENMKTISEMLKHVGSFQSTMSKASPEMKQMFQAVAQRVMSGGGGSQNTGEPGMGSMAAGGPYVGDIANYAVDPRLAQAVLSRMGVPYGQG